MTIISKLRDGLGTARQMRPWVGGHGEFLLSQFSYSQRNADRGYSDDDHLQAAVKWLETAQDATSDGGVTGRYRLPTGWTTSYPETTGYIIPTFLRLAESLNEQRFFDRAERSLEFLLGLQLESGAYPGGEVGENLVNPSPFNTGQIINGLVAWHEATGSEAALSSACRAADWLLTMQDDDGAFRQHFYRNAPSTYSAHLTCWLAQLGQAIDEPKYLRAVDRHMDWVMAQYVPETGWFELCGFDDGQHADRTAFTHTIAYTIWGVLYCGEVLGREDLLQAARQAAAGAARRLELSRGLPGLLDWRWRRAGPLTCLTGNAQMALIWMRLFKADQDPWWLNAAFKAIDEVKRAQNMVSTNPGIQGGIPGSYPIWGEYIFGGIPNWAAKYFIDALIEKKEILSHLGARTKTAEDKVSDLPWSLPRMETPPPTKHPTIVAMTRPNSTRLTHLVSAWEERGVSPTMVVFEEPPEKPALERLWGIVRERGFTGLWQRIFGGKKSDGGQGAPAPKAAPVLTAAEYCAQKGLKVLRVGSLSDPASQKLIREVNPDLLIQAGVGILRQGLLDIPTLGTLNVHMSILPRYRGMNVAEWAAFNDHGNGCTVHLIDPGIDTGGILLAREVDREGSTSIAELRNRVDQAQRESLAEVVEFVAKTGALPPIRTQHPDDGRQYFTMHPDLNRALDRELAGN